MVPIDSNHVTGSRSICVIYNLHILYLVKDLNSDTNLYFTNLNTIYNADHIWHLQMIDW